MQEVVKRLSEGFVKSGHEITVATSYHPERVSGKIAIEEFHLGGNLVQGISGSDEEIIRYKNFVLKGDFDIIVIYAAQQWSCDLLLTILPHIKAKKVFVPTGFSGLGNPDYDDYFKMMPAWLKAFDLNIFHTDEYRDHRFAKDHEVKGVIIPNGASEEEFSKVDIHKSEEQLRLVHIGNHTGQKGHDELISLYSQAKINLPSELIIMGQHKLKSRCYLTCKLQALIKNIIFSISKTKKKIILKEGGREKVLEELGKANLFVFPSNIECSPVVLYEALATKTPFLASYVGNSNEIAQWTGGGDILPTNIMNGRSRIDIHKSITRLESYCNDAEKRKSLGENGYKSWKERFTWEKIIQEYLTHFESIMEAR